MTFHLRPTIKWIAPWWGLMARPGPQWKRVAFMIPALGSVLASAHAYALPVCATTISDCCKITTADTYTVLADVPANGSYSACIKIKAPDVTLNGGNYTITGPGAASSVRGVVVEPGAGRATIDNLTLNNFGTGIEVDANRAELTSDVANYNGTGIVFNGGAASASLTQAYYNIYNGIVINGAGFASAIVSAYHNDGNGIVFNSTAFAPYGFIVQAGYNGKSGVKLKGVTAGFLRAVQTEFNNTYGIWMRGTTGMSVLDFKADGNTIAGVYLGCHSAGPSSAACAAGSLPTNGNTLSSSSLSSPVSQAEGPAQQYGVAIDIGNVFNRVLYTSGNSNTMYDGYDGNPDCGSNLWSANNFSNTNQSCAN